MRGSSETRRPRYGTDTGVRLIAWRLPPIRGKGVSWAAPQRRGPRTCGGRRDRIRRAAPAPFTARSGNHDNENRASEFFSSPPGAGAMPSSEPKAAAAPSWPVHRLPCALPMPGSRGDRRRPDRWAGSRGGTPAGSAPRHLISEHPAQPEPDLKQLPVVEWEGRIDALLFGAGVWPRSVL